MLHLLAFHYLPGRIPTGPQARAHADFLQHHHDTGVLLLSGQCVPAGAGGALVAYGITREQAEQLAATDPLVTAGVAEYQLTTVIPSLVAGALASFLDPDRATSE